ncbi:MAG TPA: hypothetical protein VID04_12125 [Methylomirabilota bacterium]
MRSSVAPRLRRPIARSRGLGAPSHLRAVPPSPVSAPSEPGLGRHLAVLGVGGVGVLTGAVIGLFWTPTAAVLAMLVAALICRADRR